MAKPAPTTNQILDAAAELRLKAGSGVSVSVTPDLASGNMVTTTSSRTPDTVEAKSKSATDTTSKKTGVSTKRGIATGTSDTVSQQITGALSSQVGEQLSLVPALKGTRQLELIEEILNIGTKSVELAEEITGAATKSLTTVEAAEAEAFDATRAIALHKGNVELKAQEDAREVQADSSQNELMSALNEQLTSDIILAQEQNKEYVQDMTSTVERDGVLGRIGAFFTEDANRAEAELAHEQVRRTREQIQSVTVAGTDTVKAINRAKQVHTQATIDATDRALQATFTKSRAVNRQKLLESNAAFITEGRKLKKEGIKEALAIRKAEITELKKAGVDTRVSDTTGTSSKITEDTTVVDTEAETVSTSKTATDTETSKSTFNLATATNEEVTRQRNIWARANGEPELTPAETLAQRATGKANEAKINAQAYMGLAIQEEEAEARAAAVPAPLAADYTDQKASFIASNSEESVGDNPVTQLMSRVDAETEAGLRAAKIPTSDMSEEQYRQATNSTKEEVIKRERNNITEGTAFSAAPYPVLAENVAVEETQLHQTVYKELIKGKTDPQQLFDLAIIEVREGRMKQEQAIEELDTIFSYAAEHNNREFRYERFGIEPQLSYNFALKLEGASAPSVTDLMNESEIRKVMNTAIARFGASIIDIFMDRETPEQTRAREAAREQSFPTN